MILAVLTLNGCATQQYQRAILALNAEIDKFNQEPRVMEKSKRIARIEYDQELNQLNCFGKHGEAVLTLKQQPDGHFQGQLTSESMPPSDAADEGLCFITQEVSIENELFQQSVPAYGAQGAPSAEP